VKKGFTLIELSIALAIIAIIGALLSIIIVNYPKKIENTYINVLHENQKVLMEAVVSIVFDENLPSYLSTDQNKLRQALRDKLKDTEIEIYNPLTKDNSIIATTETRYHDSAAVIISKRKTTIKTAINNPEKCLYPLNASENAKKKFDGALIILICEDGYIFYGYLHGKVLNIETMRF